MIFLLLAVSLIPGLEALAQNLTCRSQTRAKCFLGTCPNGYKCLNNDMCCDTNDVVKPAGECSDYVEECNLIRCDHRDFYEFARANCARTCNYCDERPLAPEYNCSDLLEDCKNRTHLCVDRDFQSMMALHCPRTCMLCTFNGPATCEDSLHDCEKRGSKFCDGIKISDYQRRAGCGKTCKAC